MKDRLAIVKTIHDAYRLMMECKIHINPGNGRIRVLLEGEELWMGENEDERQRATNCIARAMHAANLGADTEVATIAGAFKSEKKYTDLFGLLQEAFKAIAIQYWKLRQEAMQELKLTPAEQQVFINYMKSEASVMEDLALPEAFALWALRRARDADYL
jgi:hypothetical protein